MSERYTTVMDGHLAEIFRERLRGVLAEAGFVETLRLPRPDVSEFQRESDVIAVQMERAPGHRQQKLVVESETVGVSSIVDSTARAVVGDILDQILSSLESVDRTGESPTGEGNSFLQTIQAKHGEWRRTA